MAIDIGISEEDRKSIVDGLSRLLSDTYVLYPVSYTHLTLPTKA